MKKSLAVLVVILGVMLATAGAQAATRPVVLTWTASTSAGVNGYNMFRCTMPTSGTCTPSATGTPLNGTTLISGTTFTDTAVPVGSAYIYGLQAVASPCTSTSSLTLSCGTSGLAISNNVPVPPAPTSGTQIIVVVP